MEFKSPFFVYKFYVFYLFLGKCMPFVSIITRLFTSIITFLIGWRLKRHSGGFFSTHGRVRRVPGVVVVRYELHPRVILVLLVDARGGSDLDVGRGRRHQFVVVHGSPRALSHQRNAALRLLLFDLGADDVLLEHAAECVGILHEQGFIEGFEFSRHTQSKSSTWLNFKKPFESIRDLKEYWMIPTTMHDDTSEG